MEARRGRERAVNRQERRRQAKGAADPAIDAQQLEILNRAAHLQQSGRLPEAEGLVREVLKVRPDHPDVLQFLGMIVHGAGRSPEGVELIRQAIAIRPTPYFFNNLGCVAKDLGNSEEAIGLIYRAVAMNPDYADAHKNIGHLLMDRPDRVDESISRLRMAIALDPQSPPSRNYLGIAYRHIGRLDMAVATLKQAIELRPDYADAHFNLGAAYQNQGLMGEAAVCYRKALSIRPGMANAHSALLMCLSYTSIGVEALFAEYRRWERIHAEPNYREIKPDANSREPDRKLKIGIVSADFRQNPVAYNIEGLIADLDRKGFEVHCYAEVGAPDAVTARLKSLSDRWTGTVGRTTGQIANAIRADGIDILVFLAGHIGNNRILVASHKPAPVQVSYLDLSTTGIAAIDYWLTDPVAHPQDSTTERFAETLYRLPLVMIHQPPADSPLPAPPPHLANGYVSFGSFNNPTKLTDEVIDLWSQVLHAVPGSRLCLKFFAVLAEESVSARLAAAFERRGIARTRIEFMGKAARRSEHLAQLDRIDIALDPFPFNGCTTTFEALWMGVPVVTLAGNRFLGRMGASFLTQVGLTDLIAADAQSYVAKVAALAADSVRLIELRGSLRATVAASKLCDRASFARAVEDAFRDMWRKWCARGDAGAPGSGGKE
jgi:predicted O-linked N-acetylglucosamine transferase (SPINDLY family)